MNKAELIEAIASKSGLTKKDAGAALDAFTATVTETLAKKETVALIGFGTFATSERAARDGVNPSTGAKIKIAATTVAKFKVGAKLKEAVK
ncbi:MAG: HU family DNA-binding protein [Arcobacteraceae bacterium]|nr:HU family DNA-binding protein [Arcobacteraceae bacterium]